MLDTEKESCKTVVLNAKATRDELVKVKDKLKASDETLVESS